MHLQVDLLMRERSYLAVCKNKQLRSAHKAAYAICAAPLWEPDVSKQQRPQKKFFAPPGFVFST